LNTKPAERRVDRARRPVHGLARPRRRREVDDRVEQQPDPEVRERRAEEHRGRRAVEEARDLGVLAERVEQVELVTGGARRVEGRVPGVDGLPPGGGAVRVDS
jgi:hypothetical protein